MNSNEDFDGFIRTIYKETNYCNLYEFTVDLFKSANANVYLTDNTVSNWFKVKKGRISRTYTKVFKEASTFKTPDFDDDNFLKFLKDTTKEWEVIRDKFKVQLVNTGINCEIDINAVDEDDFFRSIMLQFKIIVGVPYKKKVIIKLFDLFNRAIHESQMIKFINSEPTISYAYYDGEGLEDTEADWDEAIANSNSVLQSLGIDEDDSSEDDEDYEEEDDEDEEDGREIESATISLNSASIDILEVFLNTIENSFKSFQPDAFRQVTRKEDGYISKLLDFIKLLKDYSWIMKEMSTCGENIWTATDERMSVAYCNLIISYHQQIQGLYADICDIYNSSLKST